VLRLIGIRATGAREVVDRADTVGEALDLARLYLTDPRDNWATIQVWDEAPQCRGWLTRDQAMRRSRRRP
jgi:hypothetical protein